MTKLAIPKATRSGIYLTRVQRRRPRSAARERLRATSRFSRNGFTFGVVWEELISDSKRKVFNPVVGGDVGVGSRRCRRTRKMCLSNLFCILMKPPGSHGEGALGEMPLTRRAHVAECVGGRSLSFNDQKPKAGQTSGEARETVSFQKKRRYLGGL